MVDDAPPQGDVLDIRDGVRKAHGFALTDATIVQAVDNTIRLAESVLRAAETAAAASQPEAPPSSPVAGSDCRALVRAVPDIVAVREPVEPEPPQPRRLTVVHAGLAIAASTAIAFAVAAVPLPIRHADAPPASTATATEEPASAPTANVEPVPVESAVARAPDLPVPQPPPETAPAEPAPAQESAAAAAAAPPAPVPDAKPPVVEAAAAPTQAAPAPTDILGFSPRKLDADEVASLIARGQELFAVGDISSARLMLRRAAEGSSAKAALALAATYDPIILGEFGVHGVLPDIALARAWYEKAKTFGSPDAPHRLELLASRH